jgi:hypothetical protein
MGCLKHSQSTLVYVRFEHLRPRGNADLDFFIGITLKDYKFKNSTKEMIEKARSQLPSCSPRVDATMADRTGGSIDNPKLLCAIDNPATSYAST